MLVLMRLAALAAFLVFPSLDAASAQPMLTGSNLLEQCSDGERFSADFCLGFVMGAMDATSFSALRRQVLKEPDYDFQSGNLDDWPQVFSPGIWWIGSRMNRSGSDVQILQMYS